MIPLTLFCWFHGQWIAVPQPPPTRPFVLMRNQEGGLESVRCTDRDPTAFQPDWLGMMGAKPEKDAERVGG